MHNLSQMEISLLESQKKQEELCVQKYQSYAQQAQSPELQQLFNQYAWAEQQHLNTINQILSGQVPNTSQHGSSEQQPKNILTPANIALNLTNANPNDLLLCEDALATEKYVSGSYDTAIFEFTNPQIRQTLNHIQKEEQEHGEGFSNFLQKNSTN